MFAKKFTRAIIELMKEHVFIVEQKFNNYKCKDFLKAKGVSREILLKVKDGGVYLNDLLVNNVNNLVKSGDKVKIVLPVDKKNPFVNPIKGQLKVCYEDDYMLAVYKPCGMPTHNSKGNALTSLDQLVCGYFMPNEFTFRAVNRLDRDTSGIVLIAKDEFSSSLLGEMVKNGEINKTYTAVVCGVPNLEHFIIEKPIKRQTESSMKRVCAPDGKYAKTECKLIKSLNDGLSLLEITLHTGRTHQIRVQFASRKTALYGDGKYGSKTNEKKTALWSYRLSFNHPITKRMLSFSCLPDENTPWDLFGDSFKQNIE